MRTSIFVAMFFLGTLNVRADDSVISVKDINGSLVNVRLADVQSAVKSTVKLKLNGEVLAPVGGITEIRNITVEVGGPALLLLANKETADGACVGFGYLSSVGVQTGNSLYKVRQKTDEAVSLESNGTLKEISGLFAMAYAYISVLKCI